MGESTKYGRFTEETALRFLCETGFNTYGFFFFYDTSTTLIACFITVTVTTKALQP